VSDLWSDEELEASVVAYVDMLNKEAKGIRFVKKEYYTGLSEKFDRTAKAFEFRMQNISYIYSLMGRRWLSGLRPAGNVGPTNVPRIQAFIEQVEGRSHPHQVSFDAEVEALRNKKVSAIPEGVKEPSHVYQHSTTFSRDPAVKAWVLKNANGVCECCNSPAPFMTEMGAPFLEVHHLKPLAERGSDTITNTIALCPNCHRELHFGKRKIELLGRVYSSLNRLRIE
jgi:5-methylcytosine-specific restriction protein A